MLLPLRPQCAPPLGAHLSMQYLPYSKYKFVFSPVFGIRVRTFNSVIAETSMVIHWYGSGCDIIFSILDVVSFRTSCALAFSISSAAFARLASSSTIRPISPPRNPR